MRRILFIFYILTTFATDKAQKGAKPVLKKLVKGGLLICVGSYAVMTGFSMLQKWYYGPQAHISVGEACAIYKQNDAAMVQLKSALTVVLPACCYEFHGICRDLKNTIAAICVSKSELEKKYLDEWATENNIKKCGSCDKIRFFHTNLMYRLRNASESWSEYRINSWKGHCLLGKSLQIEENGEKHNIIIANIELLPGSSGSTRAAYDLGNGFVILLPKKEAMKGWKRLVEEEAAIDKFYQQYIMTSGVKKATFEINGTTNYALIAKNFASYKEQRGFVIDTMWFRGIYTPQMMNTLRRIYYGDIYGKEWIRKIVPKPDLKKWIDMMEPIIQQYVSLIKSGVVCPVGDTLNYFFAGEGSPYASNGKPSLYLFGFDFASNLQVQLGIRTAELFRTATCSECFPCNAKSTNFEILYYLVDILDLDVSKSFVPAVIRASKKRLNEKLQSIQ